MIHLPEETILRPLLPITNLTQLPNSERNCYPLLSSWRVKDSTEENKLPKKNNHLKDTEERIPSFSIFQWNSRSLHSQIKINYLRSVPTDIFAIQEVWQRSKFLSDIGKYSIAH